MANRKELDNFWKNDINNYNRQKKELDDLIELNKTCAQVFRQLAQNQIKTSKKIKAITKNTLKEEPQNVCYSLFSSYNEMILENDFLSQYEKYVKLFEDNQKSFPAKINLVQSISSHIDKLCKNKANNVEIKKKYSKYCEDINHVLQLNISNFFGFFKEIIALYVNLFNYSKRLSNEFELKKIDNPIESNSFESSTLNKSNEILEKEQNYRQEIIDEFFKNDNFNDSY